MELKELNTIEEVENYRKEMNESCDSRIKRINLCNKANELKGKSFGYIKECFETLSPELFNDKEGKKLIRKYTDTIRNNRNLSKMHSIYESIRKANKNIDADFFMNNLSKLNNGVSKETLKEDTEKLGSVLCEAYLYLNGAEKTELPKENIKFLQAVDYIIENKVTTNNLAQYSEAVKLIKENIAKNETMSEPMKGTDLDEVVNNMITDFNKKYEGKLTKEEFDAIKEVSMSQDKENIFNRYKDTCKAKLGEAKEKFHSQGDSDSYDRICMVMEQLDKKEYAENTLSSDICNLIELTRLFE